MAKAKKEAHDAPIEQVLWAAADKLRKNMDAAGLSKPVHKNATIDWTIKATARAKLMVLVRRTLTKYGYPPDKQEKAIATVMSQAERLADKWTKE